MDLGSIYRNSRVIKFLREGVSLEVYDPSGPNEKTKSNYSIQFKNGRWLIIFRSISDHGQAGAYQLIIKNKDVIIMISEHDPEFSWIESGLEFIYTRKNN